MLTLLLLRHAKSSWDNPAVADYDRPLAKRGKKAAPRMGAEIAALGLRPDLIVCSTAVRAQETLALILPELGQPTPKVVYDDAIYMAAPEVLLGVVRKIPAGKDQPQKVMVVGHNPGFEELAEILVGGGDDNAQELMAEKFPTCSLAVFTFEAKEWSDIAPGSGALIRFLTPAQLT
jgi:phosphohistidine phosphatase